MSLKISSEKINNPFLVDLLEKSVKGDKENNQNNFYNIYSIRIETKSSALVRCSMGSVADSSAAKYGFYLISPIFSSKSACQIWILTQPANG